MQRLTEYMHIGGAVIAGVEIIAGTCGWIAAACRDGCQCLPDEEVIVVSLLIAQTSPIPGSHSISPSKLFSS